MAYYASAKKRIRRDVLKTETNKARLSRLRTLMRKAVESLTQTECSLSEKKTLVEQAQSALFRGVKHNIIPKNRASRLISRLMAHLHRSTPAV